MGCRKALPFRQLGSPAELFIAAVAVHRVVGLVSAVGIVDDELRVVENVERFGAKFEIAAFGDLEVFQQGNIEVQPAWVVEEVASGIAEGESCGSGKGGRVEQSRANALRSWCFRKAPLVWGLPITSG